MKGVKQLMNTLVMDSPCRHSCYRGFSVNLRDLKGLRVYVCIFLDLREASARQVQIFTSMVQRRYK